MKSSTEKSDRPSGGTPGRLCLGLLAGYMIVQIITGFFWMSRNLTAMPSFGDSKEYLNLSRTLVLDEYRPVLYPLILKVFTHLADFWHTGYQWMLYIFQMTVCLLTLFYAVQSVFRLLKIACRKMLCLFFSLFLFTIPMVM